MSKVLRLMIMLWGLVIFVTNTSYSQTVKRAYLENFVRKGEQNIAYKSSMIKGNDGHVYICGATINVYGNYDMILTKFTRQNEEVWTRTFGGTFNGNDFASDLAQDANGNIIITGAEQIGVVNYDAVTIKFNPLGTPIWVKKHNGTANLIDGGASIKVDALGNSYICGGTSTPTTQIDFLIIKYDTNGNQQWLTTWDSQNLQDIAARIEVRGSTVSVIGAAQQTANGWRMANLRLNAITGDINGYKLTTGNDEGIDKVADLAVDLYENTYILGSVKNVGRGYDMKLVKLDPQLNIVWQRTYDGTDHLNDEGFNLELTTDNNVVICGYTTVNGQGKNFLVQKYSGTNGDEIWSQTYDSQSGADRAIALKLDSYGNPIICGSSETNGNLDFALQKLDASTGDIVWKTTWNGDQNADDTPIDITLGDENEIYVVGQTATGEGAYNYAVTRWSEKEISMPKSTDRQNPNGFITNRGQLQNNDGMLNTDVKYYQQGTWPSTYLDDRKISYVFHKKDTIAPDSVHRIDMKFNKGSNATTKIYPTEKLEHYTNIYLGYLPQKMERIGHYSSITKPDAYANTDIIYTSHSQGYKHYIIAQQGAPMSSFEMEYSGQNSLSLDSNGNLVFGTIFGDHVQAKAKVYTMDHVTGELTLLNWQPDYVIIGNKVTFNYTGSWTGTLVIEIEKQQRQGGGSAIDDPGNIEWSTYHGGNGWENNWDLTDDEARVYSTGNTVNYEYPLETNGGAYICEDCNSQNSFVQCYNTDDCALRYSIMFGSNGQDASGSIATDQNGHIYVSGSSTGAFSGTTFYTQPFGNAHYLEEPPLCSSVCSRTFITRFIASTGEIQWSTFLNKGGFWSHHPYYPIAVNSDGELFMAGSNNNLDGIELIGNGYQFQDTDETTFDKTGFIYRFNEDLEMIWSTEFGRQCEIYDITTTPQKELVICGNMKVEGQPDFDEFANDGQWTTPPAGGFRDGFFAVFSPSNALKWSTWFGGEANTDNIRSVSARGKSLFFCGNTSSTIDFPLQQSANHYFNDNHQGTDGFIAQFDNQQLVWSTLYGGSGGDFLEGIVAKSLSEIYITGGTSSADFDSQSYEGAYNQSEHNGEEGIVKYDPFISYFNSKELVWSTYMGGNLGDNVGSVDSETGIAVTLVGGSSLYVGGSGHSDLNFPWWDFDGEDIDISYYDDYLEVGDYSDAWIARINIEDLALSVENFTPSTLEGIGIFPNPSTNLLFISFDETITENIELAVYDIQGKLVLNEIANSQGLKLLSLPISSLSDGVYSLKIHNRSFSASAKFIKK